MIWSEKIGLENWTVAILTEKGFFQGSLLNERRKYEN